MPDKHSNSRREFLQKMIALTALAGVAPYAETFGQSFAEIRKGKLPLRPLGKTGHMVSIYSLGGQGSIEIPGKEDISVEIINRALDLGINYIDTAAAYGRQTPTVARADAMGTSERNMGQVMKYRRKEVFLASKTHDRTYDGSMRLLEKSLRQLNTDHLDLWQIHNVKMSEMETLDRITGEGGVLKAMIRARDEKMIRFIGFTGHEGPDVLNALNERFPFDNVLVAINAADKHHDPFIEKFLPNAVKNEMGIVGMKIPARDRIFSNGGIITMKEAIDYVLTLPVSTIIVGLDKIAELEENISIAKEFKPLTADQMLAIEAKTKPHYKDLLFFKNLSEWPADW
ncbi:MAG: aldo/keto reductase [Bacteroidales bacterium]|jgi:aryl-alcohol dehydrogenase-like predicted oxidoreductase|nr:aldo/keto reductase [Bacteroidales bacterium]